MTTPAAQPEPLFASFVALLIDTLARIVPGTGGRAEATRRDIARALFEALKPRDAVDAMLAARMLAAHYAEMDGYARATQPGLTDEKVIRLRANAIAASRSFDAALRTLEKRRAPAAPKRAEARRPEAPVQPVQAAPQPEAAPVVDPREQIPGWPDTPAAGQRRAAYHQTTALVPTQLLEPSAQAAIAGTALAG